MSTIVRNGLILLAVFLISIWAIYPPDKKLRLGKDLAGGISLVYNVDIKPTDPPDTLAKVTAVVKERLDPSGVLEISVVPLGADRLEITMPLPSVKVNKLKTEFEQALDKAATSALTQDVLERIALMPEPGRTEEIKRYAGSDPERVDKIARAAVDFEDLTKARHDYESAVAALKVAKDAAGGKADDPVVKAAEAKVLELRTKAATAAAAYDDSSKAAISAGLTGADLRRVFALSDKPLKLPDKDKKTVTFPSQREAALEALEAQFPSQKSLIEDAKKKWAAYESERSGLDDPQDVVRILKGAGVLDFRIAVTNDLAGTDELRAQLRAGGPASVKSDDAKFYRVNKVEAWLNNAEDLEALKKSPSAYFARRGLVADEYKGAYYILCWDKRGLRLTHSPEDGAWQLSKSYQGSDQLGRPAIDFEMDVLGADKLGKLTEANQGKPMAVLLDDEVYTAPTLQSKITSRGQITGSFSQSELDYITRVLSAGSLKAKLSPEPISSSIVGPTLGADNLKRSFDTGIAAFALVAIFMIVYYFMSGVLAVIALVYNCLLVIAMMALNESAFSIPAIAGILLTFGQAVDANVLIYERVREELHLGHDLKTSVRLGFSRALSPIVDGNVSNLIICVVLGFFGTEEIRGFAITLGIGVVTTLFSTLFFTRWMFTLFLENGWRHTSQLPIKFPFVQKLMSPHVDWMRHRWTMMGALVVFLIASGWIAFSRGEDLLGMEFRSGTAVTLTLKHNTTMTRPEVEKKVKEIAAAAKPGDPLRDLESAQIIAVNPNPKDNITSDTFTIKSKVTDEKAIQSAVVGAFRDKLDVRQALTFTGSDAPADRAPAFPMTTPSVGAAVEHPGEGGQAPQFEGGLAILLDNIQPPVSKSEIETRLAETRQKHQFIDTAGRTTEVRVLEGTDAAVKRAVILVKDPDIRFEDRRLWESELRDKEWSLVSAALTEPETLAGVQSFSPAIARTFATQGIVCTILSLLLLTVYVFARFGTVRWAVAATVPLFADVIGIVGLLGLAQVLYNWPVTQTYAAKLGLLPFDLELSQIAAILTIVGYSLNDKIIILDRIRENKGKLPYASAKVINDSINQTLSRTVITAGAHMITTIALYLFGGEAVRGFAYTFNLGVLLGTYTSIVSTPLVWSRASEPTGAGPSGSTTTSGSAGRTSASYNGDRSATGAPKPAV
ncbi:MAG TPA: protein translocase subunit SecD [Phycisphaerales bacterium]|nr:protein translocase subunit SecD [Phycisphaerales bacterium]